MAEKGFGQRLYEALAAFLRWLLGAKEPGQGGVTEAELDEGRLKLLAVGREMVSYYVEWAHALAAAEKAEQSRKKPPEILILMQTAEMAKLQYDSKLRQHQNMAVEVKAAMAEVLLGKEYEGTGLDPDPERLAERHREVYVRTQKLRGIEEMVSRQQAALNVLHEDAMNVRKTPQAEAKPAAGPSRPAEEAPPRKPEPPHEERKAVQE
jgi:hypothetical protein